MTAVYDNRRQQANSEQLQVAELYGLLAELLSSPPDWLALPGTEWPLFQALRTLAPNSPAIARALATLTTIDSESLPARRARYERLFHAPGSSVPWPYESVHLGGALLGPVVAKLERLYRTAGLEVGGAELPDHASVELSFLAFLRRQQAIDAPNWRRWRRLERSFFKQHAGRWLPNLGRAMVRSNDPLYSPIGRLLAEWLEETAGKKTVPATMPALRIPAIYQGEQCTLCGFCVQVCPLRAMRISESADETRLVLNVGACTGCGKCEKACESGVLKMGTRLPAKSQQKMVHLRRSPRAKCPGCQQPTISEAELNFVTTQIGNPTWLAYCLDCRSHLWEK